MAAPVTEKPTYKDQVKKIDTTAKETVLQAFYEEIQSKLNKYHDIYKAQIHNDVSVQKDKYDIYFKISKTFDEFEDDLEKILKEPLFIESIDFESQLKYINTWTRLIQIVYKILKDIDENEFHSLRASSENPEWNPAKDITAQTNIYNEKFEELMKDVQFAKLKETANVMKQISISMIRLYMWSIVNTKERYEIYKIRKIGTEQNTEQNTDDNSVRQDNNSENSTTFGPSPSPQEQPEKKSGITTNKTRDKITKEMIRSACTVFKWIEANQNALYHAIDIEAQLEEQQVLAGHQKKLMESKKHHNVPQSAPTTKPESDTSKHPETQLKSFSKEGVKKGLEFLKDKIWEFDNWYYDQKYSNKEWNEDKHKLVRDAVDYYFKQGTESKATKKKAVKEFYDWFTTKDIFREKMPGQDFVHGFDLDAIDTNTDSKMPIPKNEENHSVREYLNNARKQYQELLQKKKKGETVNWKKDTPWFSPPPMWVKIYGKQGVSKHRVTEAWKKAVIHHTEKDHYYTKKPQDYKNEKIRGHTFIYGSNMPPDNYALVFD